MRMRDIILRLLRSKRMTIASRDYQGALTRLITEIEYLQTTIRLHHSEEPEQLVLPFPRSHPDKG